MPEETPPPSVDSIREPPKEPPSPEEKEKVRKRMRKMLLMILSVPYGLYLLWCLFLITILPSPTGELRTLMGIGMIH